MAVDTQKAKNPTWSLFHQAKAVDPKLTAQKIADMLNEEDRGEVFKKRYTRNIVFNIIYGIGSDDNITALLKKIIKEEMQEMA